MTVPAAPTAGEPIAEAWGDVVHDAVVAQDIQSGSVTVPGGSPASATSQSLTVTFSRPFATPPVVVATVATLSRLFIVSVNTITTTQVTFLTTQKNDAAFTNQVVVTWIAYGPRA